VTAYPSRRYYERVAEASSFPIAVLERVFRLTALLVDIVARVPGELLLRGGTALNLLHLEAPRLSVDLDLDYVGAVDAGAAKQRRPTLLAELEELAGEAGYHVERSRQSYALAHLILRYQNAAGRGDALKLDLNFLDRVPVLEPVRLPLGHPFGDDLPTPQILTFAIEELAAGKIVALARRGLARDLFDVGELARLPGLDLEVVRRVLVVRGAAYPPPSPEQYSATAGERVRVVDWRSQVVALARRDRPVDLVIARQRAEEVLHVVLRLQPGQLRFLRALEAGTLDATLLGDRALVQRVQANPGLLWRLQRGLAGLEER
jgi:predicted nucleotidyltransferase component of viral defense system